MNLHALAVGQISAVNPVITVGIDVSVGYTRNPDATRTPKFATPGALTASISGTVMTVTALTSGVLQVGQTLADLDEELLSGTLITGLLSGNGGIGTYSVNQEQDVDAEAMTTYIALTAQVQMMSSNDLKQLDGLNLQGSHKSIYLNGQIRGAVRVNAKGGDLLTLPDGTQWLVTKTLEPWNLTAGWTKALITLQDTVGTPPPTPSIGPSLDYSQPGNSQYLPGLI